MSRNKKLSSLNLLIVGLARNCAHVLESEINKISKSFECFGSLQWLIIESDSEDNTIQLLENLNKDNHFNYLSLGRLSTNIPERTKRIAICRNVYVNQINKNPKYSKIDYVAIVDLDGVNDLLNGTAVETCWDFGVEWDACFANQLEAYYDIWALRHDVWSPNDCWAQVRHLVSFGMSAEKAISISVYDRMIEILPEKQPIKVNSAFGGLGIYKKDLFNEIFYSGLNQYGQECCEHVAVHQSMVEKGAKLYIYPSLINGSLNEHSSQIKNLSIDQDDLIILDKAGIKITNINMDICNSVTFATKV